MTDFAFSPFLPEAMKDPQPLCRRLRADAPARDVEAFDAWALSRFEELLAAAPDYEVDLAHSERRYAVQIQGYLSLPLLL